VIDLDQKVIVLTGGASGLGRACAAEFARQGAVVVMGDTDEHAGRESAALLGANGRFVRCDVSVSGDCARLMDSAAGEFGRIDAVMSNAGIEGNGTVETCEEESWDRVMAVNLKGMFLVAKHAVPHLRRNGGGSILMTSSVSAFWGEPGTVSYNAAKGGIIGLVKAMAMDHGAEGIRVNCLCPGYHATGMPKRFFAAQADPAAMAAKVDDLIAVRRIGLPEELARTAAFMLSDANPYMTGSAIVLDGGMTSGYPWHVEA
jgi:meso-butanediol dehydrogenase / (S,S)-butanediol dehydrogenase / diacetyl reductase